MSLSLATKSTGSGGGFSLIPRGMDDALKIADMMWRSKSIPEHLKTPGDCLMVVEQAGRWEMSPFAVAQCTFSYKGRLGYEGKLIQAVLEGSPMARRIVASLMDYQFGGEGDGRYVIASALRVGEDEKRQVKVTLAEARTANEHWKKNPDQMLCYHAARVWARRWAPSIMLGVYTVDEILAPDPVEFDGKTIDAVAEPAPATREEANAAMPVSETAKTAPSAAEANEAHARARAFMEDALARIGAATEEGLHEIVQDELFNKYRARLKEGFPVMDEEITAAIMRRFDALDMRTE
jgi:hypothetical protein